MITLVAVAAGTVARTALTPLNPNLTFATYYPAVLICSLLAGWRYGFASAVLSGIVAEAVFAKPSGSISADVPTLVALAIFLSSCAVLVVTGSTLRRTVRELEQANRLSHTLNVELQHRVKNILTVVQALASLSVKGTTPEAYVETLGSRLKALATAHDLLGQRNLSTCALPELVDQACEPFCRGENIIKSGPGCELPAVSCVPLVLALHELCTNALKYGALSVRSGRVDISWSFATRPKQLLIDWREIGGPAVTKPKRKGLGSALLRAQTGLADVRLSFEESGLCCQISIEEAVSVGADDLEPMPVVAPQAAMANA